MPGSSRLTEKALSGSNANSARRAIALTVGEPGSQYFDFVTYYALTALSVGAETLDEYAELPAFRAWVERLLSFLRLA